MAIILCNHFKTCEVKCVFRYGIDTECLIWHDRIDRLKWESYYCNFELDSSQKKSICPERRGHYILASEAL
jgi:hypothetical protein